MSQNFQKEARSIILSIVFLALGLFTLWLCKNVLEIKIEGLITLIIFIPVITYLLFSGVLKSFKYGGLEATLSDSVSKIFESKNDVNIETSVEDTQVLEKLGIDELKRRLPQLDNSQFIVLTLTLGMGDYYTPETLKKYLEALSSFTNFKFVVFLDKNKKFVAYLPVTKTIKMLNIPNLAVEFIAFINNGDLYKLNLFGLYTETINTQTKTITAVKEMFDKNLDSLVVIDNTKNVVGVVERDYLVGKLLLTSIEQPSN